MYFRILLITNGWMMVENLIDEVQVIEVLKPNYELSLEGLEAQDKLMS